LNNISSENTADGFQALEDNTSGTFNTAVGLEALRQNNTGTSNTAVGVGALSGNMTGFGNTAVGVNALVDNSSGGSNIALGRDAGLHLTTGDNNIDIGNGGVGAEFNTIRIGSEGTQKAAFIAGIFNTPVTNGDVVMVTNTGQLGIPVSSARYKRDIHDMDNASSGLMKLRPVTFRYKQDPQAQRQYGLIAEEVARVYPELISYGADGKVITVHYHELVPMLLNELQKKAAQNRRLSAQMTEETASREREIEALRNSFARRLAVLEQAMNKANGRKLADVFDR